MTHTALLPRQAVPALSVPLLGAERFTLGEAPAAQFDLLVFYRGLHCPICAKYLLELERLAPEFAQRGVRVVAISTDVQERAQQMADKVSARVVQFGYALSLASAREWGLYISESIGVTSIGLQEPARFAEPGVFLVRPHGTLYSSAPFSLI